MAIPFASRINNSDSSLGTVEIGYHFILKIVLPSQLPHSHPNTIKAIAEAIARK
jgi:hypothetical protein